MSLFESLPDFIRIGPYDVAIQVEDARWHDLNQCYGRYIPGDMLIQFGAGAEINDLHAAETLIHEFLHAAYDIYHLQESDNEERLVTTFSTALVQIFRDNKWILDFIKGAVDDVDG
jgi:hypothetical protein